jgi:exopolysaccharide production protein ExoZ
MSSKAQQQIIYGVQYLRGFAALAVVFCHYGSGLSHYPMLSSIFNWGQTGIHLFFLISGFIIVYSLTKVNYTVSQFFKFLLKRSVRIDPAYYVTILLTLVLFYLLSLTPSFKGTAIPFIPQQFLAHLFYIVPFSGYKFYNHVFWTLCVEFQFYLIIGLLYFIIQTRLYKRSFLLIFSLSCLVNLPNAYYLVFTYAPVFCLGIILVDVYNKKAGVYEYLLIVLFMILIIFKFSIGLLLLLTISAIAILFVKRHNRLLFTLGNMSYSLYLTHGLIFIIVIGLLKQLRFNLEDNQLLGLSIEVSVALFVAYLFYVVIEKPSLKLSKKIFYKSKGRA